MSRRGLAFTGPPGGWERVVDFLAALLPSPPPLLPCPPKRPRVAKHANERSRSCD